MVEHGARARVAVIIEDDSDVRSLLDEVFLAAGFETVLADEGLTGLAAVAEHRPAITTLDVNLPGVDGFEIARRIRAVSCTHIIMISALDDESDVVLGLTSGADDYLVKPFRPRELRARIEAFMRRPQPAPASLASEARPGSRPVASEAPPGLTSSTSEARPVFTPATSEAQPVFTPVTSEAQPLFAPHRIMTHRDLRVDLDAHSVRIADHDVILTPTEFQLLRALLESERRVRSKSDLARLLRVASGTASDYIGDADKRAVEVHMTNLRRKIGDAPANPRYIETVRGIGYRLTSGEEERRAGDR